MSPAAPSARPRGSSRSSRRRCSSSMTTSTSSQDAFRPGAAGGWPATTGCAPWRSTWVHRTSCGCASASGDRGGGTVAPCRIGCSRRSRPRRRSMRWSRGPPTRSRRSPPTGSTRPRRASTSRDRALASMSAAEPAVPSFVMDLADTARPVLHPLVRELLADERLASYAGALPAPARVSESALPLLLAALHEHLARPLVCLLPEDADARDAGEGARWFLGEDRVALLPSRGVHWGSGLEPPPHLVGERARALHVLAAGGLVCASATALAEPLPPPEARPERVALEPGAGDGLDALAEQLALGGYERVDRVQERGQFAVRGGLVDVFPTTGRDPLRIEFFGDEIEAIRAFSPFTQRALRDVESAIVYAAAERRLDLVEPSLSDLSQGQSLGHVQTGHVPDDLVPPLERPPDLVWQPEQVREVWAEELETERPQRLSNSLLLRSLESAAELDPLPRGQALAFEAQRPAIAARGIAEAESELASLVRAGNRVVVAFPHRGEALRTANLLRRVEPRLLEPGESLPDEAELLFAVSPARRGFVWRELRLALLPETQVFRKRPPRTDARLGRALQSFAELRTGDYVVHEDHGIGTLLGFETKTVAGVTRDYLFLGFRGDD